MASARGLVAFGAMVLLSVVLGARPAPPAAPETFAESIDVDVASVEVFVTDRAGRPVAGLTRGDFELKVDGKAVPITNFYASSASPGAPGSTAVMGAVGAVTPASEPVPAVPESQRLNLVVFVDDVELSTGARYRAFQALETFFRSALHREDRVVLVGYDGPELRIRRPPPGDVEAIVAAFRDISTKRADGGHAAAEAEQSGRDLENAAREAESAAAASRLDMLGQESSLKSHLLLEALEDFVGWVAGLPGRKAVLYLTEGFHASTEDPMFKALVRRAQAEQVTLYGLGALAPEAAIGSRLELTLYQMAAPTGGLAGVDLRHPAALLDHIRDDLGSYYSLGFAPASPRDGRSHAIEVRVPGREGLAVRFPGSFAARSHEDRLAARAIAGLELGEAENPLGVRLAIAGERPARRGRRTVSLLVELPVAKLTLVPSRGGAGSGSGSEGKIALVVIARDPKGNRLKPQRATVPFRVPEGRSNPTAGYRFELELPPGAARIAVALADELGGRESVVLGSYTVGGPAAGRPAAVRSGRPRPMPGAAPGAVPGGLPEDPGSRSEPPGAP